MYLEFVPAITHKYNLILYTPPVVKSISAGGGLRAACVGVQYILDS